MSGTWSLQDLQAWDETISAIARNYGLDCYPQKFKICSANDMIGYMAYHGMPAHYRHWSFGKAWQRTKTTYDHGVSGLPYEMVINTDPCLGYLMKDNTLLLQILTIAHVYGHNDFFANNLRFLEMFGEPRTKDEMRDPVAFAKWKAIARSRAGLVFDQLVARAKRMREIEEDPSIGIDKLEAVIDAANALSMNYARYKRVRLSHKDQQRKVVEEYRQAYARRNNDRPEHLRESYEEPDVSKIPLFEESDLLRFFIDNNPRLKDWQREAVYIVDEDARYFGPQIDTKIMNEGWASYWHWQIVNDLGLPPDLQLEFIVRHNQVLQPHRGKLNPYWAGFIAWHFNEQLYGGVEVYTNPLTGAVRPFTEYEETLRKECNHGLQNGREHIFMMREVCDDVDFMQQTLSDGLMRDFDLFEYGTKGEEIVITKTSGEDDWKDVKASYISSIGLNAQPVITIHDADYARDRSLYLVHKHDGKRDLHIGYAERTLQHIHALWGGKVFCETVLKGKKTLMSYGEHGFDAKLMREDQAVYQG